MKLFNAGALLAAAAALSGANAFSTPSIRAPARSQGTSLASSVADRRSFISSAGVSLAFLAGNVVGPERAGAVGYFEDYEPKYDDLKQIYILGMTLDSLAEKVADEEKWEAALSGLREFNKQPTFYDGYAKNYISKSVKKNAADDPRVEYIKDASVQLSSMQELLEGRQDLTGKAACDDAVKRVRNAQRLIAKFLAESGVKEDKVSVYIKRCGA